ncbi:hypothetical protein BDM02DRAFT_3119463 [Thelephora ganbajun]|uniref:Uncharacterized protein n=1 Tax=Thelephora ganbajun TaxID=370292 RepID=A0ACB6Z8Z3_THEGA|nr:hypothetical protein BDM02DRAFT_3119463 [Thelephora ganbajun]
MILATIPLRGFGHMGFQLEFDDNASTYTKNKPQDRTGLAYNAIKVPPFNRQPQQVFPFRILRPTFPEGFP